MERVAIEHVYFMCRKIKKKALITCLAITPEPPESSGSDLTAFDCSSKKECGVWIEEGPHAFHDWGQCIHPDLSEQEPYTE
ncbi:MAG: hypothetical protein ACM3KE_11990 [Hyphomicrobiales bacterium]